MYGREILHCVSALWPSCFLSSMRADSHEVSNVSEEHQGRHQGKPRGEKLIYIHLYLYRYIYIWWLCCMVWYSPWIVQKHIKSCRVNIFKQFHFVPQSTNTNTDIGILRNGTEPLKLVQKQWYGVYGVIWRYNESFSFYHQTLYTCKYEYNNVYLFWNLIEIRTQEREN